VNIVKLKLEINIGKMMRVVYLIILLHSSLTVYSGAQETDIEAAAINEFEKMLEGEIDCGDGIGHDMKRGDFNGDGAVDMIVSFNAYSYKARLFGGLALFIGQEEAFILTDVIVYPYEFGSVGVKKVQSEYIYIETLRYAENDGQCCPSIKEEHIISVINGKLSKDSGIGEEIEVGNFLYEVKRIEYTKEVSNAFTTKRADGIYLMVYLNVTNRTKEERNLTNSMFQVIDTDDYEFETTLNVINILALSEPDKVFLIKGFPPKITKEIILPFEVPTEKDVYKIKVTGGFMTGEHDYITLK